MIIKISYEPVALEDCVRFLEEFCDIELLGIGTCEIEGGFSSQYDEEEE